MAVVRLYHIPEMDMNYENIPYFGDIDQQDRWINNPARIKKEIEARISVDGGRTTLTIPLSYWYFEQNGIDYVSMTDAYGKRLYYFIADYEYKTQNATTLVIILDYIQTYIYNVKFLDSFVDRCHVDRLQRSGKSHLIVPAGGIEDEGLQFGNMIVIPKGKAPFRDKFLISSTSPLGKNDWNRPSIGPTPGPGPIPTGDCWKTGLLSPQGFRYIKGYEGFAPYEYRDVVGVPTIAYGVTNSEPAVFQELKKIQPVPEGRGAQINYDLLNKNYGKRILQSCKAMGITKQYQFDALVSFSFNLGIGLINNPNEHIRKVITADITDRKAITDAFGKYINAGGQPQPGLIIRRREEANMFFGDPVTPREIPTLRAGDGKINGKITLNNGNGWLPKDCHNPFNNTIKEIKKNA